MKKSETKTLLLLDTHALIHRAYHALPPFRSKSGEPTGALYGLSTMILKSIKDFKPDYVVAAFDRPEPTFRHTAYEKYKAQRPKADDDLIHQLQRAHDVLGAFGIPLFDAAGFEADDILGTIVEQVRTKKNIKIIIVSGDADIFQLIEDDHIVVYTMRKGIEDTVIYNENKVVERFGFEPKLLPDYKGMRGDASDNIVGVPGIGEKTGAELIKHFGSLENLYRTIEKKDFVPSAFLKPRILDLLKQYKKDALFSKVLATIRRDAPIQFSLPKQPFVFNVDGAKKIFTELGFNALIRRIQPEGSSASLPLTIFSKNVQSSMQFTDDSSLIATETASLTSARPMLKNENKFWRDVRDIDPMYGFYYKGRWYFKGNESVWDIREDDIHATKEWRSALQTKTFIMPTIKDFIKVLQRKKILLPKKYFDCVLALWVCDSTFRSNAIQDLFDQTIKENVAADIGTILNTLPRVYRALTARLTEKNLNHIYENIENPLIPVLATMEARGMIIDKKFLEELQGEMQKKQATLEGVIHRLAGSTFNINSPSQVGELLANTLNIGTAPKGGKRSVWKKTSTGRISTRESELVKLKDEHPIIKDILDYRELSKILSTYIDPLKTLSQIDGRIHTTFNQEGTVTGRLSSDSPNLQNIPVRSDLGARVREAFVASPGYMLVAFDYAQVELKILASLAHDEKMINAFKKGIDIHRLTASEINNVALDDVTSKMRSAAKTINFGIIFGMGVRQLGQNTGMSQQEATAFYEEYFHDFPTIRRFMNEAKKFAREHGFVSTLYGRKRFFDLGAIRGNHFLEAEMDRMAVNAIIQGTDADIMKRAMVAVQNTFDVDIVRPLLQIHDEMIYEISKDDCVEIVPKIKKIMEHVTVLKVPLTVEAKIGERWGILKPFTSFSGGLQ